jgi:hypothetical protein
MYNYQTCTKPIDEFFTTAVGDKMKGSQAQRELPELLNMWPIHSMVQQYPRKKFRNSPIQEVGQTSVHRRSALAISKMRMTNTVNT